MQDKLLLAVYDQIPHPTIITNDQYIIVKANNHAEQLYKMHCEELFNKNFLSICRNVQENSPLPSILEGLSTGTSACYEESIQTEDNVRRIKWQLSKISVNSGKYFVMIGEDITKLREIEEQIFELDSIIAQMPGFTYWHDKNGNYLGVNENTAKALGMTREKLVGTNAYELIKQHHPLSVAEQTIKDDIEVMTSGIPKHNLIYKPFSDTEGKSIDLLTMKIPLYNKYNEIVGIVGISIDITKQLEIERELRKAKEKAESASAAKSEFIENMSHDIRTPITGMLGLVQDLLNSTDEIQITSLSSSSEAALLKEFLVTVKRDSDLLMGATDELLTLCNEILEVARLEKGKCDVISESFSLQHLIKHNVKLFQPVARHKKINLTNDIADCLPKYFKGLRHYLDRTLLNLISNALKFTESGYVNIRVQPEYSSQDYRLGDEVSVRIDVKDTGVGIPKDKFEHIFEHFSRLNPAYEGVYKGAGLGLYTVMQYVTAMHGTISLKSEVGQGTCFTVLLPLTVSDHADREPPVTRTSRNLMVETTLHPPLSSKTDKDDAAVISVLVVEDNALAANAVEVTLKPFGCQVDIAPTGAQAIEKVKDCSYHLILMDIGLPDMTGFEVTRKIRKLPDSEKSQLPIIAVTGHASNEKRVQQAYEAGMQEVLSKPAQTLALKSVLERYVFSKADSEKPYATKEEPLVDTELPKEIINWEGCLNMCQGRPTFARKLLTLLAEDLKTNTIKTLSEAYAQHDNRALRAELHRSLGGVSYLRLPRLEQAFRAFHSAVKEEPQSQEHMETTYKTLQAAIMEFLDVWERHQRNLEDQ